MRASALFRVLSSTVALSLLLSSGGTFIADTAYASHSQCSNGSDDDSDGRTDYPADNECDSLDDNNEAANEGVFVMVTDNRETVFAGGALVYVITLKQQREAVKLVDVSLHVPAQNSIVSVSDDGARQDGGVRWNKVAVFRGETRRLSVHVVVSPNAPANHMLVARVIAEGSEATDTTMVSGMPIPYPQNQLNVSVTDHRDRAGPGDKLDYVVAVRNPEPNGVVTHVRVKLPVALRQIDAPGAAIMNNELIWRDVKLNPGSERIFTFSAVLDDRVPSGYLIQVTARAGNVVAYDRTATGGEPYAMSSSITDNRDEAGRGDLLTYVIHIENASGRLYSNANIDAAIPQYSEFVSATEGGVRERENVRWLDMPVAPDGSRDLEFTVRVRSDAPDGAMLRATAMVQGDVTSDVTRVSGGLSSYRADRLYAGPLEVEKSSDRLTATAGSSVSYTISVRNTHDREIRNIGVYDAYSPSELTVTDAGSGDVRGDRITWRIAHLRPGENRVFSYSGRLSDSLGAGYEVRNTARAFSSDVDYLPTADSTVDISDSSYTGSYYGNDGEYPYLPQTGIGDFFGATENTRRFLRPVGHRLARGGGLPTFIWIAVIAAGLAGGAAAGKRYIA